MNYWQIEENRALYQYGFWWEVVLHYDEWVVWPAINLNKWPIYGPFLSMHDGMDWVENVFFSKDGEFEKHYPNTGR